MVLGFLLVKIAYTFGQVRYSSDYFRANVILVNPRQPASQSAVCMIDGRIVKKKKSYDLFRDEEKLLTYVFLLHAVESSRDQPFESAVRVQYLRIHSTALLSFVLLPLFAIHHSWHVTGYNSQKLFPSF
jgi:hypothetical protein